jgi:hypothetical protein
MFIGFKEEYKKYNALEKYSLIKKVRSHIQKVFTGFTESEQGYKMLTSSKNYSHGFKKKYVHMLQKSTTTDF